MGFGSHYSSASRYYFTSFVPAALASLTWKMRPKVGSHFRVINELLSGPGHTNDHINTNYTMKRILTMALTLLCALALLPSCEKAPFITMTGPRTFTFTRDGGTQTFTFSCNRDWSVSSSESWIKVSPSSGKAEDGEITVKITCDPNTTYDARSATVTVKLAEISESLTITQDTGIGLILSPTTFTLTNAAQDIEIEVQKNVPYSINIDEAAAGWIKAGGTKALTTDKVTFHISENKEYDDREGKITFKQTDGPLSETVTIKQSQLNGLFITTSTYDLSNEAHTLSVEVKANVEFEVTSQADWIKFVETKGLVATNVTLSIEANESYDNRTGTVLVKQTNGDLSGTITINQKQTDGLFVTPTSAEVSNQANTVTLEIKDNVNYNVVIPDDAKSWISVQSNTQTKALTDDQVVLAIAANTTYDDRETSVTIKQVDGPLAETVKIKQAYGEGLIVETKTYELGRDGGTLEVDVMSNVEYSVETEATWVHYIQTKALSQSTVVLAIDKNEGYTTREATVNVKQQNGGALVATFTVSQTPFGAIEFEGYTYKTIKYGEREWFAENLRAKYGQENNPDFWNQYTKMWVDGNDGALSYNFYALTFALMHYPDGVNYQTAISDKRVCPEGWHVSTREDWEALFAMSSGTSASPFIKKSHGGTEEFSFGGEYSKWHTSTFWLEMMLCTLFEDNAILDNSGAYFENRNANQRRYPAEDHRYLRCVRGPVAPIIQTLPVIKQTTTTAELRIDVFNDANARNNLHADYYEKPQKVTKLEFKYGKSKDNLSSSVVSTDGKWEVNLTGLTPGTIYYYQPIVEYEGGDKPIYGSVMLFKTFDGTLEYQGKTYYTTKFNGIESITQNLQATALNDGTPIQYLKESSDWDSATSPAYCYPYNDEERLEPYGLLYNHHAISSSKICPDGWRLPDKKELALSYSEKLDLFGDARGPFCLGDNTYWWKSNPIFCSNISGFSAVRSGSRRSSNSWGEMYCEIWGIDSSNMNSLCSITFMAQLGVEDNVESTPIGSYSTGIGMAVRCVRSVK